MKSNEYVDRMLTWLSEVQRSKRFYRGYDVPALDAFLLGVRSVCTVLNIAHNYDKYYSHVISAHGWSVGTKSPSHEMTARGLDRDQIFDELLSIEIEVWKRIRLGNDEAS